MSLAAIADPQRTMRALCKQEPRAGAWMIRAPIPTPGPDDVLIKVRANAICGTDVHIYDWDAWASATVPTPMIFGHEFGGEIVEIGSGVTRPLKIGQRVSAEGHIIDPHGEAAREGRFHHDPATQGVGVNRQGAFAEYLCVPAFNVVPLPDEVSLECSALLDPFGNAVHTADQFPIMGEDVLVTGAGPIGVMAAAVARKAGARSVVITDVNPWRLAFVGRIADVRPVNVASESLAEAMVAEGIEAGFGVALEMSGAPAAFDTAIEALKMGGGLALLGLPSSAIDTDWAKIIMKALTIKGVYGREMFATWRKMLALIHAGLDLSAFITHRLPIDRFEEGFAAMRSGQAGKVVLTW